MKIVLEFNDIEELQAFIRAEYPKLPKAAEDDPQSYPAAFARLFRKDFPNGGPLAVRQCEKVMALDTLPDRVKALKLLTGLPVEACKAFLTRYEGRFFE